MGRVYGVWVGGMVVGVIDRLFYVYYYVGGVV